MDYAILKSHSAEELENRVKVYLAEGFEPIGGISVTSESTDCRYTNLYCQAVVKRDETDVGPNPPKPVEPTDPEPAPPIEPTTPDPPGEVTIPDTEDADSSGNLRLFK